MTNESKFDFFQKHKVEGLQNIVGGAPIYYLTNTKKTRKCPDGVDGYFPEASSGTHDNNDPNWGIGDIKLFDVPVRSDDPDPHGTWSDDPHLEYEPA